MTMMKNGRSIASLLLLLCALLSLESVASDVAEELKEIAFDVGNGEENFLVYMEPNVTSFYANNDGREAPANTDVVPKFQGLAVKFINLSPEVINIYWEQRPGDFDKGKGVMTRIVQPLSSTGTASFPGHRFVLCTADEKEQPVHRFIVSTNRTNLYVYDPFDDDNADNNDNSRPKRFLSELTPSGMEFYQTWKRTIAFDVHYRQHTGRSYLATFPRPRPTHHMWSADYFGQEHFVETKETHFIQNTNEERVGNTRNDHDDDDMIALPHHRSSSKTLNMTLKVLSCRPRVFEIVNFLSPTEVAHILEIAKMSQLYESTLGDEKSEKTKRRNVRTSTNTWVAREQSPIIDAIYRRAADLMQINESLLRTTPSNNNDNEGNIAAERLQLVHYAPGQQYTAHHDFAYRPLWSPTKHAARFATLLLYLNEPATGGGETSMPRWRNAHSFDPLVVTPQLGKAVLFYNQLPDGNMDERSQHEAHAVNEGGEKYLINLWVWDPVMARD